jgi:hypothetical protein
MAHEKQLTLAPGGMLLVSARVTVRSWDVTRGKKSLFGRIHSDSFRIADRYGISARERGDERSWTLFWTELP